MDRFDRITADLAIVNGKPCIRGTRKTVRRVLEAVALYPVGAELRCQYPELNDEDIAQALSFAAHYIDDEVVRLEAHAAFAGSGIAARGCENSQGARLGCAACRRNRHGHRQAMN